MPPEDNNPPAAAPAAAPAAPEAVAAPEAAEAETPAPAPDDWAKQRERVANGDDKVAKRLARYSTLDEALRAGVEAQNKIGALKPLQPLSKDSTPEEVKAYREAYGVPDKPEDYKVELPDGLILGDEDKPAADAFIKLAHEHNIPPVVANAIIAQQLKLQSEMFAAQDAADAQDRVQSTDDLVEAWGSEAELNRNLITAMIESTAPPGVKDAVLNARLGDGTLLGNSTDTLKWLATLARTLNPTATLTPGNTDATMSSITGRLGELTTLMGDRKSAYWKGPQAEALQAEFRQLTEKQTLLKPRT